MLYTLHWYHGIMEQMRLEGASRAYLVQPFLKKRVESDLWRLFCPTQGLEVTSGGYLVQPLLKKG